MFRKLDASVVEEALRRWQRRQSARSIAKVIGVDRKTVGRWVASAMALKLPSDRELADSEVRAVIRHARKQAAPRGPSDSWRALHAMRERIIALTSPPEPLALSVVFAVLVRDCGLRASYATLRRYAIRELGWKRISEVASKPARAPEPPSSGIRVGPDGDAAPAHAAPRASGE